MAIHGFPFLLAVFGSPVEPFLASLGISAIVVVALYLLAQLLRTWFRQFSSDLPLVALNVSQLPILAVVTTAGLNLSLSALPDTAPGITPWIQRGLAALIVILITFWMAQLLTQVTSYGLRKYAERTEAMWDDVLLPILENTLPIVIYLAGGLLALQAFGLNLTGLWVAIGGATFVLGFALKDILANFFSGLVLLIDTPFRFGDVVLLPDNSRAIIRHIGLRVTNLYLIDSHSEIYIPNATLEGQNIINLSRPTNHYYYDISVPIKADVEPARAIRVMEDVVLAHPDTMGEIERKLAVIDKYYGFSVPGVKQQQKRESGRKRLIAEQEISINLSKIEAALAELSERITRLERGGLDTEEVRMIQGYYLDICELIGLERASDRQERQKRSRLVEITGLAAADTLIGMVRLWCQFWLEDPDLLKEDHFALPRDWEQKISVLKAKANKLFLRINEPSGQETRLDDEVESFRTWMQERFKSSRNEWQDPKIWINEVGSDSGLFHSRRRGRQFDKLRLNPLLLFNYAHPCHCGSFCSLA